VKVDHAFLHHEEYLFRLSDIRHRIARRRDDIGDPARCQRAQPAGDSE
jgi:hypothetical protein